MADQYRRVSRRNFLKTLGLSAGAVELAAACASPAPPTTSGAPTTPPQPVSTAAPPSLPTPVAAASPAATAVAPEQTAPAAVSSSGTLVVGHQGTPATLDWMRHTDTNAHEIDRQIFDTLLMRDQTSLAIGPSLAESYRLVDDKTWEFKLRRGIKFHNGEPFDGAAVKFSIGRMLDPQTGATGRGNVSLIDHVDVLDASTVRFVTKQPFPLLPTRNTPGQTGTIPIMPPGYIKDKGDDYFGTHPVGTGPYKFVEWIKDDRVVLEANPDYFFGPPPIKQIIFKPIPEVATRVSALLAGQADIITAVPPDQIGKINSSNVAQVKETELGGFMIIFKLSNISDWPGRNDKRVREALNRAIDMETLVKTVLQGHGKVLGWPLEREAFGYDANIHWYGYDPQKAKDLLQEASVADGFDFTLNCPDGRYLNDKAMAEAIAQQLHEVGVRANVQVWEQSVYVTKWRQRELLPSYMTAWGGAGLFDGDILSNAFSTSSPLSIWDDSKLDDLLARAGQSVNADQRKDLYFQAQELVYDDCPCLPVWQQNSIFAVANKVDWKPELDSQIFLNKAKLKDRA